MTHPERDLALVRAALEAAAEHLTDASSAVNEICMEENKKGEHLISAAYGLAACRLSMSCEAIRALDPAAIIEQVRET